MKQKIDQPDDTNNFDPSGTEPAHSQQSLPQDLAAQSLSTDEENEARRLAKAIRRVRSFSEERDWDQFHTPENVAKSIAIEAGELLECFQWNSAYDLQAASEELADVLAYCIHMADAMHVDLAEIIEMKFDLNARKYPAERCRGSNRKYTEYEEQSVNSKE